MEILFSSPASGNMIREGKTGQITSAIQTGVKEGMIDMDAALQGLLQEGLVTPRAAYEKAVNKESFAKLVEVADVLLSQGQTVQRYVDYGARPPSREADIYS